MKAKTLEAANDNSYEFIGLNNLGAEAVSNAESWVRQGADFATATLLARAEANDPSDLILVLADDAVREGIALREEALITDTDEVSLEPEEPEKFKLKSV